MRINPFEIERFYERWEFRTELMLSSSDCESLAVADLLALEPDARERLHSLSLGYTEVPGSHELRAAVAARYEQISPEDVLTVAAAEEGIFLAYHALLAPGEHVIVESPCYGSAIELARSTGAQLDLWERSHEDHWGYDLDALESLLKANTKLIYINSPHNPTGSQLTREQLQRIVELARGRSIVLFSDEVYRGLEHHEQARLPNACDSYERAISLNTPSKAYGLPGLRIGWLASRDPTLLAAIIELKLYTTICSSAPSELLLALALRHGDQLVQRCRQIVLGNLPLLDEFFERRTEQFEWVRPAAGPIGFPRVHGQRDVLAWCEQIAERAGVLLLPGTVYGRPDHVRFGFGRQNFAQALARLDEHLG
jgi:aspartate/methionine/tyrosine aminotransferase